jgi:hypothetical protein
MIQTTRYYEEFLYYFKLASKQQELCNVSTERPYGMLKHLDPAAKIGDDLMEHVELYDVVERKYAGFSQIVNDVFYGWTDSHPYWKKMEAGLVTRQRDMVAKDWSGKKYDLQTWLYLFILHRVTGSAINYATKPTGYHNTILFHLHQCDTVKEMTNLIKNYPNPFYTSIGYQFPSFPKPAAGYKRGGDYYLCEFAPRLAYDLALYLEDNHVLCAMHNTHPRLTLRNVGDFMLDWNTANGLKRYQFQYAAVVADIADWFPKFVDRESMFYYGSNARECISYLAKPTGRMKGDDFLDEVMKKIYEDTGSLPYNAEDVCCDFIRWIENYVRPGADYNHLDLDNLWNSSSIKDHPFGRQKAMLELGLVDTFNGMSNHPSDDYVISRAGLTADQYKEKVNELVS